MLCTDMLFWPDLRLHFEDYFLQIGKFFDMQIFGRKVEEVSSGNAVMENISGEVSVFCLYIDWIHHIICSESEFRELY